MILIPNFFRIRALAPLMVGFDHKSHLDQKPAVRTPLADQFSR